MSEKGYHTCWDLDKSLSILLNLGAFWFQTLATKINRLVFERGTSLWPLSTVLPDFAGISCLILYRQIRFSSNCSFHGAPVRVSFCWTTLSTLFLPFSLLLGEDTVLTSNLASLSAPTLGLLVSLFALLVPSELLAQSGGCLLSWWGFAALFWFESWTNICLMNSRNVL